MEVCAETWIERGKSTDRAVLLGNKYCQIGVKYSIASDTNGQIYVVKKYKKCTLLKVVKGALKDGDAVMDLMT